jgi:hypothetical protein
VSWADHDHYGDEAAARDAVSRISELEAQAISQAQHAREIEENLLNVSERLGAVESALSRLRAVLDSLAAEHEAVWRHGTAGETLLATAWDFRTAFEDMSGAIAGPPGSGDDGPALEVIT